MLRFVVLLALLGVAGSALVPGAGAGEDKKADAKEKPRELSAETKYTQLLLAASRMAEFGRKNKAPEALLAAARAVASVPLRPLDPERVKDLKPSDENPVKEAQKDALALLAEAAKLAKDKDSFESLAKPVRRQINEVKRGAVPGPQTRYGSVSRVNRQDTFAIRFRGGEPAMVIVNNTSNRGDIDLVVEDDDGNVVARDYRRDDDASVTWFPRRTSTYYIKVKFFSGGGVLRYRLTTN